MGATRVSLMNRLRTHYIHLSEYKRGLRKSNRRYDYLITLLPLKAEIHLIEIVENIKLLDSTEKIYIDLFRSWGFNLTNQTIGGRGGNTFTGMSSVRKAQYRLLLQAKLKGVKKPKGFAEHLSQMRKGLGNPAAGKSKYTPVGCYQNEKLIKIFHYPFEVNAFIGNENAWGNIVKVLSGKVKYRPYNYDWKQYKI